MKTVKITHIESGNSNTYTFQTVEEAADFYAEKKAQFDAYDDCPWCIEIY